MHRAEKHHNKPLRSPSSLRSPKARRVILSSPIGRDGGRKEIFNFAPEKPKKRFSISWIEKSEDIVIEENEDDTSLSLEEAEGRVKSRSPVRRKSKLGFAFEECKKMGVMDAIKSAMQHRDSRVSLSISIGVENQESKEASF